MMQEEKSRPISKERRVPLEGAVNFRDLGGYETSDGRKVKWGQVFRSDSLARLSARDQTVLRGMGIRLVCDFRTPGEVKKAPDRLPDGTRYLHLPVVHGEFDSVTALERMGKGDISWLTDDFMVNGYIKNIEKFGGTWGRVLNRIIDPESRPLVFHCTGGKDRAGVCAALFLLALGVPEDTVIYDHGLSNVYIGELLGRIYEWIREVGIDPDEVAPYFTAPRECIVSSLDHIREVYVSVANYLWTKAGIDNKKLSLLKDQLLE
jgi:protein-tyrosine phosphatase